MTMHALDVIANVATPNQLCVCKNGELSVFNLCAELMLFARMDDRWGVFEIGRQCLVAIGMTFSMGFFACVVLDGDADGRVWVDVPHDVEQVAVVFGQQFDTRR